jgi:glycogen debranching enzyme
MGDVNVLENFAESYAFMFFRRRIVIWGDLVKLRYGNKKSDSPLVWKRMKRYV